MHVSNKIFKQQYNNNHYKNFSVQYEITIFVIKLRLIIKIY